MAADGSILLNVEIDQNGMNKGMAEMKSSVAKLASEYRKAGLSKSEAMQKAWAETERVRKETNNAEKSTKKWENTSKKAATSVSSAFSKLGAILFSVFSVNQLVQFGKESIRLASDLQEVQNVVDVSFGEMVYKMEEFAKTSIETFGISELTAKKTGSAFMAMATGMGFARQIGSEMSIMLTALSADMASFYNLTQDEVRQSLTAVFTGETETLKRYGILITEINLEEYARQQGITKSINSMTQQEKVMLRYNYVLQATRLAQGDFVRTQDQWANQVRILSERFKQLQTEFGNAFITLGTLLLPALNSIITGLTAIAKIAQVAAANIAMVFGKKVQSQTQEQSNTISDVGVSAESASKGMNKLGSSTKKAASEAKKSLAAFDDLNILAKNISDSSQGSDIDLGDLSTGINTSEDGGVQPQEQAEKINEALASIMQAIGGALAAVGLMLLLTGNIGWGVGFIIAGAIIWSVSASALLESDQAKKISEQLDKIKKIIGPALVAIGLILIITGNIGWGVGFIIAGAIAYAVNEADVTEKDMSKEPTTQLLKISEIVGITLAAVGIVLIMFGQVPIGVGFIIAGMSLFNVSREQLNKGDVTTDVGNFLKENEDLIVGISLAMLAIGLILMVSGIVSPLSLGLIAAGAVGLVAEAKANETTVTKIVEDFIKNNTALIAGVSAALLALGVLLVAIGVSMPLGFGLIAVGAVGLVAVVAANWNYIWEKVTEWFDGIWQWVKTYGLLVLGIILVLTGAGIPLGIALILKGSDNLAEAKDPFWEFLTDKIKEIWKSVKGYWNNNISKYFTFEWWCNLGKAAMNGLIDAVERGVNSAITLLNSIFSVEIPSIGGEGGGRLGLNIPPVKIPRLAKGAVIPPNREFMAVLGDQRSGTNVEAPVGTIIEACKIAIAELGGTGGNQTIILEVDGRVFGRAVVQLGEREKNRVGTKLVVI